MSPIPNVGQTIFVEAATLPLPDGAATQATLALIKAKTDNLDVAMSTRAVTGLTDVQLRAAEVPISLASLPGLVAGTARVGGVYLVGGQQIDEGGIVRAASRAFTNATGIGNTAVVAAQGAGVRVRVLSVLAVAAVGVTIKFQSATTDITAGFPLGNNGGVVLPYNPHGWFETAANEALNINLSLGTATGVQITWCPAT